jgi:hypothetical protein
MVMPQLFFTSYSHINRDRFLERFIEQLRSEVLQRGPGGLRAEEIAFFDSEGIQTGEEWVRKLAAAVSECKVCVAVCTPAFTNSEFCGKEINVFIERLRKWEQIPGNAGTVGRSILPVIWVKAALPDVLGRFQYDEKAFPSEYMEHGLRTLFQLPRYAGKRGEVIITLAERIVKAADSNLPPSGPLPHFDQISSIFHEQRRGSRYGIALVPLLKGGLFAKPYGQSPTLRDLMDEACLPRVPWRVVEQDGKLKQRLDQAKENREAIVVVTDLDTLSDPMYGGVISTIDSATGEQTAILLIGSEGQLLSASQEQGIEVTFAGSFPTALPKAWYTDWKSIHSLESLRKVLEETITKLRSLLVKGDPGREASDPKLVAQATAEGVPIERQPILTGPGGKGS